MDFDFSTVSGEKRLSVGITTGCISSSSTITRSGEGLAGAEIVIVSLVLDLLACDDDVEDPEEDLVEFAPVVLVAVVLEACEDAFVFSGSSFCKNVECFCFII